MVGEVLDAAVAGLVAEGWVREEPAPDEASEPPSEQREFFERSGADQRLSAMLITVEEGGAVLVLLSVEAPGVRPCSGGTER